MTDYRHRIFDRTRSHVSAGALAIAGLAVVAVVVLFAWNSFAVPVFDAEMLRFKEAFGLTVLVAIAGRLLTSRGRHHERLERQA